MDLSHPLQSPLLPPCAQLYKRNGRFFMTHKNKLRNAAAKLKDITVTARGVFCIHFSRGSHTNVCVRRKEEQSQRAVYEQFCIPFSSFPPPSPHFFTSPLHLLCLNRPPPSLPQSPSTSRLFNPFQISACLQTPGRVASLLMEFGGKGVVGPDRGFLTL